MLLNMFKKNRNFIFLLIGQFISLIGDRVSTIVFLSIVISLVGNIDSSYQSVLLIMLQFSPLFLFGYFFGLLADLKSKKSLMLFSDIGRALIILSVFFLYDYLTLPIVYVCVFLIGILSSLFEPAKGSIIPFLVKSKDVVLMNKIYSTFQIIAMLVGFAVGAFLLELISTKTALFLDFTTYLVSIIFLSLIKYKDNSKDLTEDMKDFGLAFTKYVKQLKQGFNYLRKEKNVRYVVENIIFFQFLATAIGFATITDFGIRTASQIGILPASNISLCLFLVALGGITSPLYKLFVGKMKESVLTHRVFYGGTVMLVIATLVINFVENYYYYTLFLFFLLGFFAGVQYIRFMYLIHTNCEKKYLGRVVSLAELTWSLVVLIGLGLGSFINELYTFKVGIVIVALVYLTAAIAFHRVHGKVTW